ncbi:MAG: hypothetical protein WC254_03835 [Candidatus Woesearchaeota archaeon]|jgi:hypothetical protein
MTNITLSIPQDLKQKMDCFEEMNWSAVARHAFEEKIHDFELIKKFKENSTVTEDDAIQLGKELNKKLTKKYSK